MGDDWYYKQNEQEYGPVSEEELIALIKQRKVSASDLVRKDNTNEWAHAMNVKEFNSICSRYSHLDLKTLGLYALASIPIFFMVLIGNLLKSCH